MVLISLILSDDVFPKVQVGKSNGMVEVHGFSQ
jgi:hypothetical protein